MINGKILNKENILMAITTIIVGIYTTYNSSEISKDTIEIIKIKSELTFIQRQVYIIDNKTDELFTLLAKKEN